MDQFMVDVTEIGDVKKGDEVTLIGRDGDELSVLRRLVISVADFPMSCCDISACAESL